MSMLEVAPHEEVAIQARRAMTYAEKLRRWIECGCVCMVCKRPCAPAGRSVIWDHRVPLAIGGTNELSNMEPHHAGPCAVRKTAKDAKVRAKVKRIRARADHSRRRRKAIVSRGFDKSLRRKMSGEVVKQTSAPADDTDAV